MKKYLLPLFLILNTGVLISLGLAQVSLHKYIDEKFYLAVETSKIAPIENLVIKARSLEDNTQNYYYVRTMIKVDDVDGIEVFAPLFCSVTQVANYLRQKSANYDEQDALQKRTLNAKVIETADKYVIVETPEGERFKVHDDWTITPITTEQKEE